MFDLFVVFMRIHQLLYVLVLLLSIDYHHSFLWNEAQVSFSKFSLSPPLWIKVASQLRDSSLSSLSDISSLHTVPLDPSTIDTSLNTKKYIKIDSETFTYLKEVLGLSSNILTKLRKQQMWFFTQLDYHRQFLPIMDALKSFGFTKKNIHSIINIIPTLFREKTAKELLTLLHCMQTQLDLADSQTLIPYLMTKPRILLQSDEEILKIFSYLRERLQCSPTEIITIFKKRNKLWLLPSYKLRIYDEVLRNEYGFTNPEIIKMTLYPNSLIFTDAMLEDIIERNYLFGQLIRLTKTQFVKLCLFYPKYLYIKPSRIISVINAANIGLGMKEDQFCMSMSLFSHGIFTFTNIERLILKCRRLMYYLTNCNETEVIQPENIRIFESREGMFLAEQLQFERRYNITWLMHDEEQMKKLVEMENFSEWDMSDSSDCFQVEESQGTNDQESEKISEKPDKDLVLTSNTCGLSERGKNFTLKLVISKPTFPLPYYISGNSSEFQDQSTFHSSTTSSASLNDLREDPSILRFFDAYYVSKTKNQATNYSSIWQDTEYDHFLLDILQSMKVDFLPSNDLHDLECILLPNGFTREDLYRLLWKEIEELRIPHDIAVKLILGQNFYSYPLSSLIKKLGLLCISLGLTAREVESIIIRQPSVLHMNFENSLFTKLCFLAKSADRYLKAERPSLLEEVPRGFEQLAAIASDGNHQQPDLMKMAVRLYRDHPVRALLRSRILQSPKILIKSYYYF